MKVSNGDTPKVISKTANLKHPILWSANQQPVHVPGVCQKSNIEIWSQGGNQNEKLKLDSPPQYRMIVISTFEYGVWQPYCGSEQDGYRNDMIADFLSL